MALLQAVVEWDLFEVDLTRLPEAFFTFLFLGRKKLGDVGVMALGHVLMPAFLNLITLHVVHIFHLEVSECTKMLTFIIVSYWSTLYLLSHRNICLHNFYVKTTGEFVYTFRMINSPEVEGSFSHYFTQSFDFNYSKSICINGEQNDL